MTTFLKNVTALLLAALLFSACAAGDTSTATLPPVPGDSEHEEFGSVSDSTPAPEPAAEQTPASTEDDPARKEEIPLPTTSGSITEQEAVKFMESLIKEYMSHGRDTIPPVLTPYEGYAFSPDKGLSDLDMLDFFDDNSRRAFSICEPNNQIQSLREAVGESFDEQKVQDTYTNVYSKAEVQYLVDSIWGEGRYDVGNWGSVSDWHGFIQTSKLLIEYTDRDEVGYGGANPTCLFGITHVNVSGGTAVVSVRIIVVGTSGIIDGTIQSPPRAEADFKEEMSLERVDDMSYSEAVSLSGIDEGLLRTRDYIVYKTPKGVRLWETRMSGTYTLPNGLEYVINEVQPDSLEQPRQAAVRANGGLRMRSGPSTDYGQIRLIPDKATITVRAEQNGWAFVKYDNTYGWASLEYIVFS